MRYLLALIVVALTLAALLWTGVEISPTSPLSLPPAHTPPRLTSAQLSRLSSRARTRQ